MQPRSTAAPKAEERRPTAPGRPPSSLKIAHCTLGHNLGLIGFRVTRVTLSCLEHFSILDVRMQSHANHANLLGGGGGGRGVVNHE